MSAILSADDLNDFISPGVACIKPVETLPPQKPSESNPYEVTTEDALPSSNLPPAQISLTDCLACSGCVTSAEAVLVSLQSHTEVLNALDSYPSLDLEWIKARTANPDSIEAADGKILIASVSPQTRASIAATYGVSENEAGHIITQLLCGPQGISLGGKRHGRFAWVVDTNVAREACLVLGADEVLGSLSQDRNNRPEASTPNQPILTSSCPGWICYAEKTHPHVLPHLSRLKSPQALLGTLLKSTLSKLLNIHPSQIWHLAIMPCFDKKLEASREELTDVHWTSDTEEAKPREAVRDVDCVITTRELLLLADARGIKISSLPRTPLSTSVVPPFPDPVLQDFLFPPPRRRSLATSAIDPGTSGGYLAHILTTYTALHSDTTITATRGRNADVVEYRVTETVSGSTRLKAARYYGFKNIQNLVRKLKPPKASNMPGLASRRLPSGAGRGSAGGPAGPGGRMDYAYIEVMACPGGCTNGGGQIKASDRAALVGDDDMAAGEVVRTGGTVTPAEQKHWQGVVDEAYFSDEESPSSAFVSADGQRKEEEDLLALRERVRHVLAHWTGLTGIALDRLAYTSYRAVQSDVGLGTGVEDGDRDMKRVVELAGRAGGGW
ncbi:MAG: Cytosolic Fe-S cluster assembly factor nar1 [Caeruleum heppii]|nr:MAG: Cytosolic Fe-S cluster assembly factor nar1 [Caeruleum heppii]